MTADLYQKQIDIEKQYSHESILASIKQTQDAIDGGRIADTSIGKRIITRAYAATKTALEGRINSCGGRGIAGKYFKLLQRVDIDVVVVAGIRAALGFCTQEKSPILQDVFRNLGQLVETEALIAAVDARNSVYLDKTLAYLKDSGTDNLRHRSRTFNAAATSLKIEWDGWSAVEKLNVGRILMTALFETGLFLFVDHRTGKQQIKPTQIIRPSDALAEHLDKALESAKSVVRFPPMIVPPLPRHGLTDGGYLTSWYQVRAELCSLRAPKSIRRWVYAGLGEGKALVLKSAMSKAQAVPYRVNKEVMSVLATAVALGEGAFGTPRTAPVPKAEFPFGEGWVKDAATPEELNAFAEWKNSMHAWHTQERTRAGQSSGILSKLKELRRFKDYNELYFPTFVDWRGRLYFRSALNPQSNDAVKGCLEFADGKALGERGLFWLKVHVANSAGFDKHLPEIKAKWTEDNMELLTDFMENPITVDAPEPETACTLYQAMLALTAALSSKNPHEYVCHVPVAMDATCSGLQHFSAMLRDPIGALHTNLIDNNLDQKSDIYKHVGAVADGIKNEQTTDVVVQRYWRDKEITRGMAKRPVMTYVYGSTLKSTMEYLIDDMMAMDMPIVSDDQGNPLYTHKKLVGCIGKAIRAGVACTVPAAYDGMKYLQQLVRCTNYPIKWVSPVGMPVVNWVEKKEQKRIMIRSMGRTDAVCSIYTGEYDARSAVSGISPNFIHSADGAHLCMVIDAADCQILPIHDSFATHPCDVDHLHTVLREQFVKMNQDDLLGKLASTVIIKEGSDIKVPEKGSFDLNEVLKSPFMFC